MEVLLIAITAVASILASGGMWSYLQYRHSKGGSQTRLIRGIGYTSLMNQCTKYIRRGKITQSEYVELSRMLYEPYKELGGNGAADRAFKVVGNLPVAKEDVVSEAFEDGMKKIQEEYGVEDRDNRD